MPEARVALIFDELRDAVYEDLDWFVGLPDVVWEGYCVLARTTPASFRSRCPRAAHEPVAQFEHKILQKAAARLSLYRGDKEGNVKEFLEEEEPDEPFHLALWHVPSFRRPCASSRYAGRAP